MKNKYSVMLVSGICMMALHAQAVVIPIANNSFENPVTASGGNNGLDSGLPGWNVTSNPSGDYVINKNHASVPDNSDGNNWLYLVNRTTHNANTPSAATQGIGIVQNGTYTMTFLAGTIDSNSVGDEFSFGFYDSGSLDITTGINAFATETPAERAAFQALGAAGGDSMGLTISWTPNAADLGKDLYVRFGYDTPASDSAWLVVDNVEVDFVAVPEPATLGLFALFGGLTIMLRKRKK